MVGDLCEEHRQRFFSGGLVAVLLGEEHHAKLQRILAEMGRGGDKHGRDISPVVRLCKTSDRASSPPVQSSQKRLQCVVGGQPREPGTFERGLKPGLWEDGKREKQHQGAETA